ncbi:hypothetical protein SAMN02927903_03050 [Flavobacterium caeni]|uniref:Uncharacterized protein n=1 Tax=Flavobacterium caeni TaxID=490189 RepID=A0A1G5K245_9FLAO|nr:hypothetical protein SAMN02927903_03050 [Flavobacterium caeni]
MVGKALDEAVIDRRDASSFNHVQRNSKDEPVINFRLLDSYLMYYMNIRKPHKLKDREWAELVQSLHYIRTQESKSSENPQ